MRRRTFQWRVNMVNKLDPTEAAAPRLKTIEARDRNKRVGKLAFHKAHAEIILPLRRCTRMPMIITQI